MQLISFITKYSSRAFPLGFSSFPPHMGEWALASVPISSGISWRLQYWMTFSKLFSGSINMSA
jgi:hypothetical protein